MMEDLLKLSNQLCFPVYTLSKELIKLYRPVLAELDLTYPQYIVMLVLWEHNTLSVNKIGELINLDSGTLTPLLKRLEAKEIVIRERSKHDERIVEISLSEKGKELKNKAVCVPIQLSEKINVSVEELNQAKSVIKNVLKALENG